MWTVVKDFEEESGERGMWGHMCVHVCAHVCICELMARVVRACACYAGICGVWSVCIGAPLCVCPGSHRGQQQQLAEYRDTSNGSFYANFLARA